MRRVALAVMLMGIALPVFAGGIVAAPGAKANAMGGAYTGLAQDLSAVYWNPAGLAQQKKVSYAADCSYSIMTTKSNTSLGNAAMPDANGGDFLIPSILPTEPANYQNTKMDITSVLPLVGVVVPAHEYTLAVAAYMTGGSVAQWKDTVADVTGLDSIAASLDAYSALLVYNVSAAREVLPKLTVGIGLDAVTVMQKADIKKTYTRGAASRAPMGYAWRTEQNGTGMGLQANAGAQYGVSDALSVGAVLRSGTKVRVKGTATFTQENVDAMYQAASGGLVTLPDASSTYETEYTYPMSYGVGASYKVNEGLTIAAGIDGVNYYDMRDETRYATQSALFVNTNAGQGWHDTIKGHIGVDYVYNEKLSLQAGFQNDPCPFSRTKLTLIDANQYDAYTLSFGGQYALSEAWLLGGFVHLTRTDKPEYVGRSFEFPINAVQFAATYRM